MRLESNRSLHLVFVIVSGSKLTVNGSNRSRTLFFLNKALPNRVFTRDWLRLWVVEQMRFLVDSSQKTALWSPIPHYWGSLGAARLGPVLGLVGL